MKILGLITARKNSKRLPGKNIMLLGEFPLVKYTIDAAVHSNLDDVAVSTDDLDVCNIANDYSNVFQIMRYSYLCEDRTPHLYVVYHALEYLKHYTKIEPDAIMILQPTSPFRTEEHINQAIELMQKTQCDTVVGIEDGKDKYHGAMYLFKTSLLLSKTPTIYGKHVVPLIMSHRASVNIDTLEDFNEAKKLL